MRVLFEVLYVIYVMLSVSHFYNSILVLSISEHLSIRDASLGYQFLVGAVANSSTFDIDNEYGVVLSQQYNLVTAEWGCKWWIIRPSQSVFDFLKCDKVLLFAKSHQMKFRFHNLCWGVWNPQWLNWGKFTPMDKKNILRKHIDTVMEHYKDYIEDSTIYAFDVVNEPFRDDGKGLKVNIWYPDLKNYIQLAFQFSRDNLKNKNKKLLFLNEYGMNEMNEKSDFAYNYISKNSDISIDGIGFQMHLDLSEYTNKTKESISKNLKRFSELGLIVHISEMTVKVPDICDSQCLFKQEMIYKDILSICIQLKNCTDFQTWGFTDKYPSWVQALGRHPLPFDEFYQPKPAAIGIVETLLKDHHDN